MKLLESLNSGGMGMESFSGMVPTIIVSDGRIRTDPDNPGRIPHICHPQSRKESDFEYEDRCPDNIRNCGKKVFPPSRRTPRSQQTSFSVSAFRKILSAASGESHVERLKEGLEKVLKFKCTLESVSESLLRISSEVHSWCGESSPCVGDMQQHIFLAFPAESGVLKEHHTVVVHPSEPPQTFHAEEEVRWSPCSLALLAKMVAERVSSWDRRYNILRLILCDLNSVELKHSTRKRAGSFTDATVNLAERSFTFSLSAFTISVEVKFGEEEESRSRRAVAVVSTAESLEGQSVIHRSVIDTKRAWLQLFAQLKRRLALADKPVSSALSKEDEPALPNHPNPTRPKDPDSPSPSGIWRELEEWQAHGDADVIFPVKESSVIVTKRHCRHSTRPPGPRPTAPLGGSGSWKVQRVPLNTWDGKKGESEERKDSLKELETRIKSVLESRDTDKSSYLLEMTEQSEFSVLSAVFYGPDLLRRYTVKIRLSLGKLSCRTEVSHRLSVVNSLWKLKSRTAWQDISECDPDTVVPPIIDSVQEWLSEDAGAPLHSHSSPPPSSVPKECETESQSLQDSSATVLIKREHPLDEMFEVPKRVKTEAESPEEWGGGGIDAAELMRR